ncbi:exopolysaccharide biosynthesis polyprenyl glycosylphosphotransferase [Longimycelium tulufanense]|uniref:Exopolysaccharide biosynthesis polyprenyl glycosylphosphotransferase n=1 Tax=Longimycelium tulufanense TaxID=907463 RepID=A0A8J3CBW5_9PSEU|nr:sugar transferase [Longimycelium tulufanense]GGM50780.1 exopolysaccharide biosynthesis polyprenyl glycosylphosphotransferase [Longimycelium tulufanense]
MTGGGQATGTRVPGDHLGAGTAAGQPGGRPGGRHLTLVGRSEPPRRSAPAWERRYQLAVLASDLLLLLVSGFVGLWASAVLSGAPKPWSTFAIISPVLAAALLISRAWEGRALGQGFEEYRRLGRATVLAIAVLAIANVTLELPQVNSATLLGVAAFAPLASTGRYLLRRVLHARRRRGECLRNILVAGSGHALADFVAMVRRGSYHGWRVSAVCTGDSGADVGAPVVGGLDEVAAVARSGGYEVVALVPDPYWTPSRMQLLVWELEGAPVDLVVAPVLMEVTGPRLRMTPAFGLPMLHASKPVFTGPQRVLKEIVDRVGALALLVLLSPLMLLVAAAIRLDDSGPVLYRQQRLGRDGRQFEILKFRSMSVDADARRHELAAANEGAGPLFKVRCDPRVTRVGAVLRRFSIDELPQLLNVLTGSMSLVGPRPPLPEEVRQYEGATFRRLLVKPGITGLWQISGRSDLSWEESVRLDLRYVENWSLSLDLVILWKTVFAVVRARGAY